MNDSDQGAKFSIKWEPGWRAGFSGFGIWRKSRAPGWEITTDHTNYKYHEILFWCTANLQKNWEMYGERIFITDESDLTLFKLRWM